MLKPILVDHRGNPLKPTVSYQFRRSTAKNTESLRGWLPQQLFSTDEESRERDVIVKRSIDLVNDDPHAAGIVDCNVNTIIGYGLRPIPQIAEGTLDFSHDAAKRLSSQMVNVYKIWAPNADSGRRMDIGGIQRLVNFSHLKYGEYFCLLRMIDRPDCRYKLACQVINPLRVKTPVDKINDPNIRDGIEIGADGETTHIWIKKSGTTGYSQLPDISSNFLRQSVRTGHRINVLHGFSAKDPEQVRGLPILTPAIKYFRNFSDLLNTELISNIVTSALSYFVEIADNPYDMASRFATDTETVYDSDNASRELRYQKVNPGQIMYGNSGEKIHMLNADRPGTTFDPFTKLLKKAISMACNNIPYPVLFHDVDGVNFAGFRSAMLEAWRIFTIERHMFGDRFCQPIFNMLQEEAWLLGDIEVDDFYNNMHIICKSDWRGMPKGDIEPVKAATTNKILRGMGVKTDEQIIFENGDGDFDSINRQLKVENDAKQKIGGIQKSDTGSADE